MSGAARIHLEVEVLVHDDGLDPASYTTGVIIGLLRGAGISVLAATPHPARHIARPPAPHTGTTTNDSRAVARDSARPAIAEHAQPAAAPDEAPANGRRRYTRLDDDHLDDDHLDAVAACYRDAPSGAKRIAVADTFGVPNATARSWIQAARTAGILDRHPLTQPAAPDTATPTEPRAPSPTRQATQARVIAALTAAGGEVADSSGRATAKLGITDVAASWVTRVLRDLEAAGKITRHINATRCYRIALTEHAEQQGSHSHTGADPASRRHREPPPVPAAPGPEVEALEQARRPARSRSALPFERSGPVDEDRARRAAAEAI